MPRAPDDGLRAIGARLLEAARAADAYGLAAIHIGALAPVAVISTEADPARRDYVLLYNPVIVESAEAVASGIEGSVSMPGVEVAITRPVWVEVAWTDGAGQAQRRLTRLKRDMVLRKWRKSRV